MCPSLNPAGDYAPYQREKFVIRDLNYCIKMHHIGLFFLAESFVYGVIGSVGGYLIGQILSLLINYTGWVKGINWKPPADVMRAENWADFVRQRGTDDYPMHPSGVVWAANR